MQKSPLLTPEAVASYLHTLLQTPLDNKSYFQSPFWGKHIQTSKFLKIQSISEQLDKAEFVTSSDSSESQLIARFLNGSFISFSYLVSSGANQTSVYVGTQQLEHLDAIKNGYEVYNAGLQFDTSQAKDLGKSLNSQQAFAYTGFLRGVPSIDSWGQTANTHPIHQPSQQATNFEHVINALHGETWGFLVCATPYSTQQVVAQVQAHLTKLTELSPQLNVQRNQQKNIQHTPKPNQSVSESDSYSQDLSNYWAKYASELVEADLERYRQGRAEGMWSTEVLFFAKEQHTIERLSGLLKATFSGPNSKPEPIRTFISQPGTAQATAQDTTMLLTSSELAALCELPQEEVLGLPVKDHADFAVNMAATAADSIPVGKVKHKGHETKHWLRIDREDLPKHGLITGVTGAGKTNTMFHLLNHVWQNGQGAPFLVLEPAKTEYRQLLAQDPFSGKLANVPPMRVYTLGDERIAPFRINPFAFEIVDADTRVHVQTHIDFLKAVFNAAFILYAPMPYVLETALHEVYVDKGWNLTTGQNDRMPAHLRGQEQDWPVFPTLTDLYNKIDDVVKALGYDERIERDVTAGLKARIGSLRIGGKGQMLDTAYGVSIGELLSTPTVLEMERIGNDDEKAFLIGIILTRLYEYRTLEAKTQNAANTLRHVIVFEEAHRLLKNTDTSVGSEESNAKAQAVETFANMLSEIRAYGQSVLIAEQIPVKLAPDAIKNTNLKLMHRMVSIDDREVLGGTMNLTEDQTRYAATLAPGEAIAWSEGLHRAALVRIPKLKDKSGAQKIAITDQVIATHMTAFSKTTASSVIGTQLGLSPIEVERLSTIARSVLEHEDFAQVFAGYFLSFLFDTSQAISGLGKLLYFAERQLGAIKPHDQSGLLGILTLEAAQRHFRKVGQSHQLLFNVETSLFTMFANEVAQIALAYENKSSVLTQLVQKFTPNLDKFKSAYKKSVERKEPYEGCYLCSAKCSYRHEVNTIVDDRGLRGALRSAVNNKKWANAANVAKTGAERLINKQIGNQAIFETGLCFLAQYSYENDFAPELQREISKMTATELKKLTP